MRLTVQDGKYSHSTLLCAIAAISVLSAFDVGAQVEFVDVTAEAGLERRNKSYAAAAADFNRDGFIDLAVSNHGFISLMRNNGEGSFDDVSSILELEPHIDSHGIAWLDINSDGWVDLFVVCGGNRGRGNGKRNRLLMNKDGISFIDAELPEIVSNPNGGGRSVTPIDFNNDGLLDLVLMNYRRPGQGQRFLLQNEDGFTDAAQLNGWNSIHATGVNILSLGGDRYTYIPQDIGVDAGAAYVLNDKGLFINITDTIGLHSGYDVRAVAPLDFDCDGDLDLYYVSGKTTFVAPPEVRGRSLFFVFRNGTPDLVQGVRFKAEGSLEISITINSQNRTSRLRLGQSEVMQDWDVLRLNALDSRLDGEPLINTDTIDKPTIHLWRNSEGELVFWLVSPEGTTAAADVYGRVLSDAAVPEIKGLIGTRKYDKRTKFPNSLYRNDDGKFVEIASKAGVSDPGPGRDAIIGDFDNDGWPDIYVLNGSGVYGNDPNVLYVNARDGTFIDTTTAAHVGGPTDGRSDDAVVFDYDRDGDLDIFLINGGGLSPVADEGPWVLYRNESPRKNWLQVELRGKESNLWGIGSLVTVTSGNYIYTQQRTIGSSHYGGSLIPLHFGLGQKEQVEITVHWPSGTKTTVNTGANKVIVIEEE